MSNYPIIGTNTEKTSSLSLYAQRCYLLYRLHRKVCPQAVGRCHSSDGRLSTSAARHYTIYLSRTCSRASHPQFPGTRAFPGNHKWQQYCNRRIGFYFHNPFHRSTNRGPAHAEALELLGLAIAFAASCHTPRGAYRRRRQVPRRFHSQHSHCTSRVD